MAVLLCILLFTPTLTVLGGTPATPAVYDGADLLTDEEEATLQALSDTLKEETDGAACVVITTFDFYSNAIFELEKCGVPETFAHDYAAVVIFVSFSGTIEFETYTEGSMTSRISDGKLQTIMDHIEQDIKYGDVMQGISTYFHEMTDAHTAGHTGTFIIVGAVLGVVTFLAILIGVVVSYKRKSRSPSYPLSDFTQLYLTEESEHFRTKVVTVTHVSSSSGSSGRGGGGGGGGRSGGRR